VSYDGSAAGSPPLPARFRRRPSHPAGGQGRPPSPRRRCADHELFRDERPSLRGKSRGGSPRLGLAPNTVPVAVEPVRIGWPHRKVCMPDLPAIEIGRRRRDAHRRIRGVASRGRGSGSRDAYAGTVPAGVARRIPRPYAERIGTGPARRPQSRLNQTPSRRCHPARPRPNHGARSQESGSRSPTRRNAQLRNRPARVLAGQYVHRPRGGASLPRGGGEARWAVTVGRDVRQLLGIHIVL
jgi:hypothetical protein